MTLTEKLGRWSAASGSTPKFWVRPKILMTGFLVLAPETGVSSNLLLLFCHMYVTKTHALCVLPNLVPETQTKINVCATRKITRGIPQYMLPYLNPDHVIGPKHATVDCVYDGTNLPRIISDDPPLVHVPKAQDRRTLTAPVHEFRIPITKSLCIEQQIVSP